MMDSTLVHCFTNLFFLLYLPHPSSVHARGKPCSFLVSSFRSACIQAIFIHVSLHSSIPLHILLTARTKRERNEIPSFVSDQKMTRQTKFIKLSLALSTLYVLLYLDLLPLPFLPREIVESILPFVSPSFVPTTGYDPT